MFGLNSYSATTTWQGLFDKQTHAATTQDSDQLSGNSLVSSYTGSDDLCSSMTTLANEAHRQTMDVRAMEIDSDCSRIEEGDNFQDDVNVGFKEKKMRLVDGSASPTRCVSFASSTDRCSFKGSSPRRVHFAEEPTVVYFEQDPQEAREQAEWVAVLTQRYMFNHICCHLEKEHKIWERLDSPQGMVIEEAWYRYTDMVQQRLTASGALDTFARRFAEVRASKGKGSPSTSAAASSTEQLQAHAHAAVPPQLASLGGDPQQPVVQQQTQLQQLHQQQQQIQQPASPLGGLAKPVAGWQAGKSATVSAAGGPQLTFLRQPQVQRTDTKVGWVGAGSSSMPPSNSYITVNRGHPTNIQRSPQAVAHFTYANGVQVVVQKPEVTAGSVQSESSAETGVNVTTERVNQKTGAMLFSDDRSVTSGDSTSCRGFAFSSPGRGGRFPFGATAASPV